MNRTLLKAGGLLLVFSVLVGGALLAGNPLVQAVFAAPQSSPLNGSDVDQPGEGVLVARVVPDSPAAQAGLARGDILLKVGEQALGGLGDLFKVLSASKPGDTVGLTVRHGDDTRVINVTLTARDEHAYLGIVPCGCGEAFGMGGAVMMAEAMPMGTVIHAVKPGSPAEQAGLAAGDIVVAVDGLRLFPTDAPDRTEPIEIASLGALIAAHQPGDIVTLTIERPGEDSRDVQVTLGDDPEHAGMPYLGVEYMPFPGPLPSERFELPAPDAWPFPGKPSMPYGPFGGDVFDFPHGLTRGAIIDAVEDGGPAASAGLTAGEIITAVNGQPIESPDTLTGALAASQPGDTLALSVYNPRDQTAREVTVTLTANPDKADSAYLGITIGGFFMHRESIGPDEFPANAHGPWIKFHSAGGVGDVGSATDAVPPPPDVLWQSDACLSPEL